MALDLLFTGLLLFTLDESGVTIRFVDAQAHGHVPRLVVTAGGAERTIPILKSLTVTSTSSGRPDSENSFDLLVPSISNLATKAQIGSLDSDKLSKLISLRLTGGILSAEGGTRWCKFEGEKIEEYGILSSIVRWKGKFSKIMVDGAEVPLTGADEVFIHNDTKVEADAKPHFSTYFDLLKDHASDKQRPIPCRGESKILADELPAVQEMLRKQAKGELAARTSLSAFIKGNPLLCPPAQQ